LRGELGTALRRACQREHLFYAGTVFGRHRRPEVRITRQPVQGWLGGLKKLDEGRFVKPASGDRPDPGC
jgi:hypothetical protein